MSYEAYEFNPGPGGVEVVKVPQMDVPRRLLKDVRKGRVVISGQVEHQDSGETAVSIVWGPHRRTDGSRPVLAWYECLGRDS
jgi:hypothetical protein